MKSYRKMVIGFTLVEIMVALVVVGILAAVAFPTYRNYLVTAEIAEGLLFADEERIKVEVFYETHGRMPQSSTDAGVGNFNSADRIQQVLWRPGINARPGIPAGDATRNGRLVVVMDLADLFGGDLAYTYTSAFYLTGRGNQQGGVDWACIPATDTRPHLDPKFLPGSCQVD